MFAYEGKFNMINFEYLEKNVFDLRKSFLNAEPFEHILIDNFCDEVALRDAVKHIPLPEDAGINKSRDFIFAKNKFEKSDFNLISPGLAELKNELLSERFEKWISEVTGEKIFIDSDFHGGGLHQGGIGSYLNMHVDFNFHPLHKGWFRNINLLLYLNDGWQDSYGGELKLVDGRKKTGKVYQIKPIFNRAVLMFTRDYTMHGYDEISFPEGEYRRSIAVYGYTEMEQNEEVRTTVWYPESGGVFKRILGKNMPRIIRLKSKLLGSGTQKNK